MSKARFAILQGRAVSDQRVSDSQFRTLAALGTFTDKEGWCFPSLNTIGRMLGKSAQAVSRDIIGLVHAGYVEKRKRKAENGAHQSNLYRLVFDLPYQPDVDTLSTSEVDTLSTSEVELTTHITTQENAAAPAANPPSAKKGDILDGMIEYQFKPAQVREAIKQHFKLTPNWEAKYNRQFMEWAVENCITSEQVSRAAETWRNDRKFNWQAPTLRTIQEHWLELIGYAEEEHLTDLQKAYKALGMPYANMEAG